MAAERGHSEIVRILAPLTKNANAPAPNGNTPIHTAAFKGHSEIIKILTPLTENPKIYMAAQEGHPGIRLHPIFFRKRRKLY